MADNLTTQTTLATIPTGTVIATDDAGASGHVQVVKLAISTDGSATPIPAEAANGLDVDVTRVQGTVAVSAASLPLPTGAATAALQTQPGVDIGDVTVNNAAGAAAVNVQDGGNSLTVDGTVAATQSGTWTVQPGNTPNTSPWLASIHDGTTLATVRNLAANDALNVAIVDGAGGQVTSFGGGTQYTEDDAAPANPVGTVPVLVRDDTPNTQTTTDGDIVAQRGTNYGAAYVQVVTSAGAFVDAFGGSGGTAQADESAFTEGVTNLTPVGGVLNDTITSDPTEDQAAAVRITAKRAFHVNLRDVGGTEVGTAGAPVRTDPTGTTAQPVTDNGASLTVDNAALAVVGGGVEATALRVTIASDSTGVLSVDDNGGALTVDGTVTANAGTGFAPVVTDGAAAGTTGIHVLATDGTNAQILKTDTAGELQVDVLTLPALVAGTANIGDVDVLTVPAPLSTTGNGTAATALRVTLASDSTGTTAVTQATASSLNAQVVGNVAHDTAASGNPVTVAGSHETPADSAPTNRLASVTDGDVQRISTVDGAVYVVPGGPQQWKARLTGTMTDTTVKASPGAGLSLYITTIVYSIGAATASTILLEESTTTAVFGPHYLEAVNGRGLAVTFGTPIKITAATLLSATNSGSTTATLDVYGFTAPG